eukprot:c11147_g1_i2.p1 GENE.c11147_g1_i2~~c11147_g1_i2.p1  ORF type:complete len:133 (-),score=30.85 c11147_g1_i2:622-990(-)
MAAEVTHDSLFELQEKTEHHTNQLKSCHYRRQAQERDAKIANVSIQELKSFPEESKTFPALGRAFIFKTMPESIGILERDAADATEAAGKLAQEIAYHTKQLEDCRNQLQEIMEERKKRGSE